MAARDRCVHELVERQAALTPDAVAVVDGSASVAYGQLDERANAVAAHLRARGVGPGALVGLRLERSLDMVAAALGVLKAGAAYLPLDPAYPPPRIELMLADADAALVLDRAALLALPAARAARPPAAVTPESLAYVMYTSGSTGRPKGICVPHRAVVRLVSGPDYVALDPTDAVAFASNASFDAATFEVWGALANGARLVVASPDVVLSPRALAAFIREHGITVLFLTTALFNKVAAHAPGAFAPLRHLLFGGEAVDPRWVRAVLDDGAPGRLVHVYGPTENTTFSTFHDVREVPPDATTVPIGTAISGSEVRLLDERREPVAAGEPGELYLGGDGLALGYLNDPELTRDRFVDDPAVAGARLFRTGDLGRAGAGGAIEFCGRVDDQVKLRGFRVEPAEVEATLIRHAEVRECAVVARGDAAGDKRLIAYVVAERADGGPELERQVDRWRALYDDVIYRDVGAGATGSEPTFNIAGWTSSYTGLPLAAEDMREQVDQAVERILALRPGRVLEIGCGTGLLLFPLAARCDDYWGTDFSTAALGYLGRQLAARPELPVTLLERTADDFTGIEPGSFDVVVLNSVVQHFPTLDYLLRVLDAAAAAVAPGGFVFVGDVRSLPLLEAFHASVELYQAPDSLPAERLRHAVAAAVRGDRELVVDPRLFGALAARAPGLSGASVRLKRGRRDNELTRFRYDAVLGVGQGPPAAAATTVVSGVDNARVLPHLAAARLLAERPEVDTAARLREQAARASAGRGTDPEDYWRRGRRNRIPIEVAPAADGDPAACDVVHQPAGATVAPDPDGTDLRRYANDPLAAAAAGDLVPRLRRHLRDTLPDYMVPSSFVVVDRLPLTPNGKVDRRALPDPPLDDPARAAAYLAPRSEVERTVAAVWSRVLGVGRVGTRDNFFEIGGDSLKATEVIEELRDAFDVDIPIVRLFDRPTVRDLAATLASDGAADSGAAPLARGRGQARRERKRARA